MVTSISEETDVEAILAGVAELNRHLAQNPSTTLRLQQVKIHNQNLSGAPLSRADLSRAEFDNCKLVGARFDSANLEGATFKNCSLQGAIFTTASIRKAHFIDCELDEADFTGSKGFSQIESLKSCRVVNRSKDVIFDVGLCRFVDRALSWSSIRAMGQLKLFAPAYAALAVSICFLSLEAFANTKIMVGREFVASFQDHVGLSAKQTQTLYSFLQPIRPSWRHFAVLISTLSLAVGSSLYLLCPSRVREFTIDQWRYLADTRRYQFDF